MTSIELTEEHKSKLLEMCKVLLDDNQFFTEFRFSPIIKTGFFNKKNIDINFIQYINQTNGTVKSIHWFEFCMTHLARKVCKSDGITLTFKDDNNNIVDFLYEQFKKLK